LGTSSSTPEPVLPNSNLPNSNLLQNLTHQQQMMLSQSQRGKLPFPTQRPGIGHSQIPTSSNNVNAAAAATANRILQNNLIAVIQQNMHRNQLLSAIQGRVENVFDF